MNYWSFGDYIGIGAGAHGKLSLYRDGNLKIMRTQKATQPRLYLADPTETQVQEVGEDQVVLEFMLNALRCVEGVDKTVFERSTGRSWQSIEPQWQQLVDQGLVRADRCATTPLGLRYLDSVVASFID